MATGDAHSLANDMAMRGWLGMRRERGAARNYCNGIDFD